MQNDAGAAIASPRAVRAQQTGRMPRVAMLTPFSESDAEAQSAVTAFRNELQQFGWTVGRNVQIENRWATGGVAQLRAFAKELVDLQPDVILVRSTPGTPALLQETRVIPIVFVVVSDPVGDGLVESLARPGGNVTGFSNVESSMGGKWLELLKEVTPGLQRVVVMLDPNASPGRGSYYYLRMIEDAAPSAAVKLVSTPVHDSAEIEHAMAAITREPGTGLIVLPDVTTNAHRDLIVTLAARHRLPAVYAYRYIVNGGGLISYGVDVADLYRRAAAYVDRILRGAKPADLPVQGPVKFELAVNLKTARALGLAVPQTLLARADEVIE